MREKIYTHEINGLKRKNDELKNENNETKKKHETFEIIIMNKLNEIEEKNERILKENERILKENKQLKEELILERYERMQDNNRLTEEIFGLKKENRDLKERLSYLETNIQEPLSLGQLTFELDTKISKNVISDYCYDINDTKSCINNISSNIIG